MLSRSALTQDINIRSIKPLSTSACCSLSRVPPCRALCLYRLSLISHQHHIGQSLQHFRVCCSLFRNPPSGYSPPRIPLSPILLSCALHSSGLCCNRSDRADWPILPQSRLFSKASCPLRHPRTPRRLHNVIIGRLGTVASLAYEQDPRGGQAGSSWLRVCHGPSAVNIATA